MLVYLLLKILHHLLDYQMLHSIALAFLNLQLVYF
nr:MAG TPA: hypothetical protein [Bacteriophage sp.]